MSRLPAVEVDPETGYAYIALAEIGAGGVRDSVPLHRGGGVGPSTLDALVLDFDRDGRLVGIEVNARADAVLRPELLAR